MRRAGYVSGVADTTQWISRDNEMPQRVDTYSLVTTDDDDYELDKRSQA
jgi:hypothetical protein